MLFGGLEEAFSAIEVHIYVLLDSAIFLLVIVSELGRLLIQFGSRIQKHRTASIFLTVLVSFTTIGGQSATAPGTLPGCYLLFQLVLVQGLTCLPGDEAGVLVDFEHVDGLGPDVLAQLLAVVHLLLVGDYVFLDGSFHWNYYILAFGEIWEFYIWAHG